MRTVRRVQLGKETVERIAKELKKIGTVKIETGANGKPDIEFEPKTKKYTLVYGIECKRCKGIAYKKSVSSVYITKSQWNSLKGWCTEIHMLPLVIVEIVIKGGENLYFVLEFEEIENRFNKGNGKAIGLSMWQIIHLGKKLEDYQW